MRSLKELGHLVHDAELELPEKVEDLVDENLFTLCVEAKTRIQKLKDENKSKLAEALRIQAQTISGYDEKISKEYVEKSKLESAET